MMSQGRGCGKRTAFSKDCGKPLLLGLSRRSPRVWEACGQAGRAGAPWGPVGRVVGGCFCPLLPGAPRFLGRSPRERAQSTGFPYPSSPAPVTLAAEIRESAGFGPLTEKRNYRIFNTLLPIEDAPLECCKDTRSTLHRFTVPSRSNVAQIHGGTLHRFTLRLPLFHILRIALIMEQAKATWSPNVAQIHGTPEMP
jgi:hypothetical protein